MTSTTTEEFTIYGLSVGHGCDDCFQLRIRPEAVHTSGPSYELVASIEAGHGDRVGPEYGIEPGRGQVDVVIEDIPKVIAKLQAIYDRAVRAEAEQRIPAEWPVH